MSQELVFDARTEAAKNLAWWLYIIHAVSFVFSLGAFSFVPLIINYLRRGETAGTFVYSHHSWQIRSFWWYAVWVAVSCILMATFIGIPFGVAIWGVAWLWKAYRLIKGISDLNRNLAMPG
ncbi:hypothetical protein HSX11_26280 [Oxalobacteraceae bacterium]|nr:hypothetical protein [Oxalobacteraceae bacterium]